MSTSTNELANTGNRFLSMESMDVLKSRMTREDTTIRHSPPHLYLSLLKEPGLAIDSTMPKRIVTI